MTNRRESTNPSWQCRNRECLTVWSERPDTWACQHTGCDIYVCEEIGCKRNCSICDKVVCHEHSVMRNEEPLCLECLAALDVACGCDDPVVVNG